MSTPRPTSNVYLLPAPLAGSASATSPRRRLPVRLRWVAWWWRLQITVREVTDALRRFGRPAARRDVDAFDLDVEPSVASAPRRSAGPAQVIELAAARRRRAAR
jgi:hypothetical protein